MTNLVCPRCGRPISPADNFCTACGISLARRCRNPACADQLHAYEKFCPTCGTRQFSAQCETCDHFREAVAISTVLRVPTSVLDVAEVLSKIKEEEVKLRDEEAKIKVDLLKVEQIAWGFPPLMHSYCGQNEEENVYEIHELKNRDGFCSEYQQLETKTHVDCITCTYREIPPDPYQERCSGVMDPKLHSDCVHAMDKDRALELFTAWIQKGVLPRPPHFMETCWSYSEAGQFAVCDFFNLRRRCPRYERKDFS